MQAKGHALQKKFDERVKSYLELGGGKVHGGNLGKLKITPELATSLSFGTVPTPQLLEGPGGPWILTAAAHVPRFGPYMLPFAGAPALVWWLSGDPCLLSVLPVGSMNVNMDAAFDLMKLVSDHPESTAVKNFIWTSLSKKGDVAIVPCAAAALVTATGSHSQLLWWPWLSTDAFRTVPAPHQAKVKAGIESFLETKKIEAVWKECKDPMSKWLSDALEAPASPVAGTEP